ncbi:MAG: type II toxin-antitoxin system RelE/ParE family toxin [Deltaproteobacteria bacterium]|nr:type II toxin-antitoxin system RelE/ParE family toxin [Deltaproteobacteria bacterium]
MGRLRWTERASKNLQAIFDYISRDSRVYAARYVKGLIHSIRKLENVIDRFLPLLYPSSFEIFEGDHYLVST